MGNLIPNNHTAIDVLPPSSKLFNFHTDGQAASNFQTLICPSYIHKGDDNLLQHSQRSKYGDRQYELNLKDDCGQPTLQLTKISTTSHEIWKSLAVDEQVELKEGDNLKLADIEFTVKKICRNYSDLQGLHDNLNITLS
jgi:hypothetical protein